jgi:hypothetical protein
VFESCSNINGRYVFTTEAHLIPTSLPEPTYKITPFGNLQLDKGRFLPTFSSLVENFVLLSKESAACKTIDSFQIMAINCGRLCEDW